jgi:hypothetical protein
LLHTYTARLIVTFWDTAKKHTLSIPDLQVFFGQFTHFSHLLNIFLCVFLTLRALFLYSQRPPLREERRSLAPLLALGLTVCYLSSTIVCCPGASNKAIAGRHAAIFFF